VEYLKQDYAAAARDFAAAMENRDGNPYAALRLYLAKARTGKRDATPLSAAANSYPADQWPLPIVAFYLGKISEPDLVGAAAAADPETMANLTTETQYYLGQWSLLQKDAAGARRHFQAAVATKADRADLEFIDAGLELKRLAP
jgi:lipoprotein NlpI